MYSKRKSYLNYPMMFRRCFELIGLDVFKNYIPGLKSDEKYCDHYGEYARLCREAKLPIIVECL